MSPLVLGEVLVMFANRLTADGKYPFQDLRICKSQLKCNYLKNRNLFLIFLFYFWNLYRVLNILKKMMIVIANVFPKLQTVKILVRPLSK